MTKRNGETKSEHKARANAYMRDYRPKHLGQERARCRKWYAIPENRERSIEQSKQYYKDHPEVNKRSQKKYRQKNLERVRESSRKAARRYYVSGKARARHTERYFNDPVYNLSLRIRSRIRVALHKGYRKTRKVDTTVKLLGCSYGEFKRHIESRFTEGMAWDGVFDGSIHIDHIKPISSFDLNDPLQQKAAFHFTNCQPLWARDNLIKSSSDKLESAKIIQFPTEKAA